MKTISALLKISLAAVLGIALGTTTAQAQQGAKVHGHVTNPAGTPLAKGDVKLTLDKSDNKDKKFAYTFPLDANGNYTGEGILGGDYLVIVVSEGKNIDFQTATFKPGDDKTLDFDMTRAEYVKSMTPEQKAALEEYKRKNAAVSADNAKIQNINKVLLQAIDDEKNGKADDAVASLKPMTDARPDEPIIWQALGQAQLKAADQATAAARAAKTPVNDPAIIQKYQDAVTSYQKAIDLNATAKKPATPDALASYYLNLGQALAHSGKLTEANAAYEKAATTSPAMAGTAWFNDAVFLYQAQKLPEANAAADKAIAADPKRADAFYIKAQSLVSGATMDPKTNKFILPPGCLEAYQEYLELAPDGGHATEVKELLANLGQPVKNSFRAGKK